MIKKNGFGRAVFEKVRITHAKPFIIHIILQISEKYYGVVAINVDCAVTSAMFVVATYLLNSYFIQAFVIIRNITMFALKAASLYISSLFFFT